MSAILKAWSFSKFSTLIEPENQRYSLGPFLWRKNIILVLSGTMGGSERIIFPSLTIAILAIGCIRTPSLNITGAILKFLSLSAKARAENKSKKGSNRVKDIATPVFKSLKHAECSIFLT